MLPPRRLAEKGLHKKVWRALNDFRDYMISITPTGGYGVRINRTSRGVIIEASASGAGDTRDDMIFVGDWTSDVDVPYKAQDVFIKDGTTYVTLELDPKPGETAKQDPANSTRYRALGGGGGGGNMRFRGDFVSSGTTLYVVGDVVTIRSGPTQGLYWCYVADPTPGSPFGTPATDPATGARWIMLTPGYSLGNYV